MIIKNINLALAMLSSQIIMPMEKKEAIKADVYNMLSECESLCIFTQNDTPQCMMKCFNDYGTQKEHFLIRKYTQECQHLSFDEPWFFRTEIRDRVDALAKTNEAYMQWQNPAIAACAKKRLQNYSQELKNLEQESNNDLDTFRREHPIVSRAVDIRNWVSRLTRR